MNQFVLTIAVPTYNRSDCLDLLLGTLLKQAAEHPDVEIVVIDNASTDDTSSVLRRIKASWPGDSFRTMRNSSNLGLDGNASECFTQARGKYVWIFGDDDLITANALDQIVPILKRSKPDLTYIESNWREGSLDKYVDARSDEVVARYLPPLRFAKMVNTFFTFLSGVIVNKKRYLELAGNSDLRLYAGTSLGLMQWVYTLLERGTRFVYIRERLINARAGHAGGYRLFEVFGTNFEAITRKMLSHRLASALLQRHVGVFLPVLVWNARFSKLGTFENEKIFQVLKTPFRRFTTFWLLVAPITSAPRPIARLFHAIARACRIFSIITDRFWVRLAKRA